MLSGPGAGAAIARGQGWRRIAGGVVVLAWVILALSAVSPKAALGSAWTALRTPNPPGARYSVLSGVSCASRTVCTAVGYFTNRSRTGVTLAERWNGTRWSIQRTPNLRGATSSLLFGVSCASRTACTAVGSVTDSAGTTVPLVERWNGARWSTQDTPKPSPATGGGVSYLAGVSCASTTVCVAIGHSGNSGGTAGVTLAERWNGTRWAIERTPDPVGASVSFLSGVSCSGLMSCTAAGFFINAAGGGETLAERWNGSSWSVQPTPTPAGATYVQLLGVSCASPMSCTTAGFFTGVTGIQVMLAEHWNGTDWVIEGTRYPPGARYVQLLGVSCASPTSCTAVGLFNNVPGIDVMLAEHWQHTRWVIQSTPGPATGSTLGAVSCPSTVACIAVGGSTNRDGVGVTLAERDSTHAVRRRTSRRASSRAGTWRRRSAGIRRGSPGPR